jgi:Domain of unknown function (DUF4342)
MEAERIKKEEHRVPGERLLARVKQLVHQGNIRRVIIQNDEGVTLIEIPLTLGVVGAILIPIWVAVGAIAALAADYRIVVEKVTDETEPATGTAEEVRTAAGATPRDGDPIR